ncbi:hypothetical protein GCM10022407_05340 [Hymenobacter antarcticus]|uniref:NlpC/P60 domain-containing protein n=2 Tax=Hymenobacter antarcticus TaxID=486270 RepID=A0ABP7P891_9BACT
MVVVVPRLGRNAATPVAPRAAVPATLTGLHTGAAVAYAGRADSVVAFGLAQRGTPYFYAGVSPITGFDCSGFILYTFARFRVPVPHSTALLISVGQPVARAEAQPGDIVVFTGTATTSTTPGHAGIVVSARGEVPLRFVHASSSRREPFVKVNQVEGSDYERRFMQVRRVLVPGTASQAVARPRPVATLHSATAVAALPVRNVPVTTAKPAIAPPAVLAIRKTPAVAVAKRKTAAPVTKKKSGAVHSSIPKKKTTVAARARPARKPSPKAAPTKRH